jgi:hypothetical protein
MAEAQRIEAVARKFANRRQRKAVIGGASGRAAHIIDLSRLTLAV